MDSGLESSKSSNSDTIFTTIGIQRKKGGVKEIEDSEQGFVLGRSRIGANKRRNSGSLVLFCLYP